jgi:outer membrane protein
MKHLSTILSVIALALIAVLFYFQFSTKKTHTESHAGPAEKDNSFKMAYFDIDSLQNNYQFYKDALEELKSKEQSMNNELQSLEKSYQRKIQEWQQRGSSMSQSEAEAANREYQQMQANYQQRRGMLEQQIGNLQMEKRKNIKEKIEAFLKDYNKDRKYAYILSYEPELMFYKDSAYDITADLIKGLNAGYQPIKK